MSMLEKLNKLKEPLLKDDVEIRVGSCAKAGASFLLYKTARVDTRRLNDVFGLQWKREHRIEQGKYVCRVSVFDDVIKEWISREDVGTESNTEKEKGAFSDAFKRACCAFGLGIELYDAPFIFIKDITELDGTKNKLKDSFYTKKLSISKYEYTREEGVLIEITHSKDGVVFSNFKDATKNQATKIENRSIIKQEVKTQSTPAPIQEKKPVVKQEAKTETKSISFKDFKTKIDNAESEAILKTIYNQGKPKKDANGKPVDFLNVEFDAEHKEVQFGMLTDAIQTRKNELIKE